MSEVPLHSRPMPVHIKAYSKAIWPAVFLVCGYLGAKGT